MVETFFSKSLHVQIAEDLSGRLDAATEVMTAKTIASTRASGDALEEIVRVELKGLLGDGCEYYRDDFGRKDMQDLEFGYAGYRYLVDVKTFRREVGWGAPNLTSVFRLADLYQDEKAFFVVLLITYDVKGDGIEPHHVEFAPIEWLAWSGLKIGALGKGQIQLRDSAKLGIARGVPRREWMEELYETTLRFYDAESDRIKMRVKDLRSRLETLQSGS